MSESVRTVSLEQLDQMLDTPVRLAELQAKDYMARGMTDTAVQTIRIAVERRERDRAQILARAQQPAQPAAPAQPAPHPVAGQPAVPGQPAAAAPAPQLTEEQRVAAALEQRLTGYGPMARQMMPPPARQNLIRQAERDAGIVRDPRFDPSQPMWLTAPLPDKPRI